MEVESETRLGQSVGNEMARNALDELLADSRFRANERGRSILRYIAHHYFEGSADSIKGYAIAIDVLGRQVNFNPSTDPIVRIELSRLRSALTQYYEAHGGERDISVHVPRGHYTVVFTRKASASEGFAEEPAEQKETVVSIDVKRKRIGSKFITNTVLLLAALFATSLVAANQLNTPTVRHKPSVGFSMYALDDRLIVEASRLQDALLVAMTRFQTLNLQVVKNEDPSDNVDYALQLKYYEDGNEKKVWWQIKSVDTKNIISSGVTSNEQAGRNISEARENLVDELSRTFAASHSAINLFELEKAEPSDLGNICVLRAELIMARVNPLSLPQVKACLEKSLSYNENDSDANAALAQLLLFPSRGVGDFNSIERSQELARQAVMASPNSDRAQIAMMLAQYYSGKVEAAIDSGRRALAMNPHNPTIQGLLAWIMFANGRWDEAVNLAKSGSSVPSVAHTSSALVLAFDAYRRGDWPSAAILAEQVNSKGNLISALRIAALSQLNPKEGRVRLEATLSESKDFIYELQTRLHYERMTEPVPALLLEGIKKAENNDLAAALVGAK